jgi:hypothetical protein
LNGENWASIPSASAESKAKEKRASTSQGTQTATFAKFNFNVGVLPREVSLDVNFFVHRILEKFTIAFLETHLLAQ